VAGIRKTQNGPIPSGKKKVVRSPSPQKTYLRYDRKGASKTKKGRRSLKLEEKKLVTVGDTGGDAE